MSVIDRGMKDNTKCFFIEPWIGQCDGEKIGNGGVLTDESIYAGMCCEKHAKEKCAVCGGQAFTRCMASIGVMCGVPLCDLCGEGEMCLQHACRGPLVIIRDLRKQLAAKS